MRQGDRLRLGVVVWLVLGCVAVIDLLWCLSRMLIEELVDSASVWAALAIAARCGIISIA
ncbi:hypothetical protein DYH55_04050 [Methylovirgula sp. 4M-Z18]|nr:hypothetical protein DYH55_04050 [Methylovirgula sp. 4M-Z18]